MLERKQRDNELGNLENETSDELFRKRYSYYWDDKKSLQSSWNENGVIELIRPILYFATEYPSECATCSMISDFGQTLHIICQEHTKEPPQRSNHILTAWTYRSIISRVT